MEKACPYCGELIKARAIKCRYCGEALSVGEDKGLNALIPASNPLALTAYYCGIFSLIPLIGFILGPLGFVLGVLGWGKVKANPEIKGTAHAWAGIILGGLSASAHYGFVLLAFFTL